MRRKNDRCHVRNMVDNESQMLERRPCCPDDELAFLRTAKFRVCLPLVCSLFRRLKRASVYAVFLREAFEAPQPLIDVL